MTVSEERDRIRRLYAHFLTPADAERHPLYAALCERAAHDDAFIDVLLDVPIEQARPNLLLAALHDLALHNPTSDLAVHYPSAAHFAACGQSPDAPSRPPLLSPLPHPLAAKQISRWMVQHRDKVRSNMEGRSTQTNEVGRNAVLTAGVASASPDGRPIALIDLGCSAGLNLLVDRYRIERSDGVALGPVNSPIVITCDVTGSPMPTRSPPIAWRIGVDLDPPDLEDDDAVRWLLACQWPDDLERFERSRRAMAMWRASSPRPEIVAGDALTVRPEVIARVPPDLQVVVQHSWVLTYLSRDAQERVASMLREIMTHRPLAWLSFEHPRLVPGLGHPAVAGIRISGATNLVLESTPGEARVLAQSHPHGSWVHWEA